MLVLCTSKHTPLTPAYILFRVIRVLTSGSNCTTGYLSGGVIFFPVLLHAVVKQMDRRGHKICRAINPTICRDSNAAQIQPLSALVC